MTEEEAKSRWCPFVRVSGTEAEWHTNRPSHADVDAKPFDLCIASACMAWRRQTVMIDRTTNEPAVLGVSKLESLEPRWSDQGFCGLAGAPQ